jgi:hypothetical protein
MVVQFDSGGVLIYVALLQHESILRHPSEPRKFAVSVREMPEFRVVLGMLYSTPTTIICNTSQ